MHPFVPGQAPPFFGLGFDCSAMVLRASLLTFRKLVPARARPRPLPPPPPQWSARSMDAPRVTRGP